MKRKLLISAAAAALLLGTGLATAQGTNEGKKEGAAPAPAAQKNAPAEKIAPAPHLNNAAQEKKPAETTGQAQKEPPAPAMSPGAAKSDDGKAAEKTGVEKSAAEPKGAAPSAAQPSPSAAQVKPDAAKPAATTGQNAPAATGAQNAPSSTTGQGAAGTRGAVNLTTEQRTKITTVIKEKAQAQPVTNVNFSISVGSRVPREVRYYPLPAEVVEIYPAWRGYYFILVGNEIVVIEPSTFEIVAILEA